MFTTGQEVTGKSLPLCRFPPKTPRSLVSSVKPSNCMWPAVHDLICISHFLEPSCPHETWRWNKSRVSEMGLLIPDCDWEWVGALNSSHISAGFPRRAHCPPLYANALHRGQQRRKTSTPLFMFNMAEWKHAAFDLGLALCPHLSNSPSERWPDVGVHSMKRHHSVNLMIFTVLPSSHCSNPQSVHMFMWQRRLSAETHHLSINLLFIVILFH